jgi:hypothetical protein
VIACRSDDDRPDDISVAVLKRTVEPDPDMPATMRTCWLPITSGTIRPKLVEGLVHCMRATADDDDALFRGADQLQVVVDYTGLEFDESATVAAPKATVSADGVVQTSSVTFAAIVDGNLRGFRGPLTVPPVTADTLGIVIEASVGYASVPLTFDLRAPEPTLTVEGCVTGCMRTAAVGKVDVRVKIPARSSRTGIVRSEVGSTITNTNVTLDMDHGGVFEGSVKIPVPATNAGTWQLSAIVDDRVAPGLTITLERPVITAQLLCGATCTPAATVRTGLKITAPQSIDPATAIVNVVVDGTPLALDASKALTTMDNTTNTVSGIFEFTPPARSGAALSIEASVAGFPADTLLTTIGPAPAP